MSTVAAAPATTAGLAELSPGLGEGADGRLELAGCALADLAAEFGSPALLVDEPTLRNRARGFIASMRSRRASTDVHFASKAFPCSAVIGILAEEGLGCDVASAGELAIALAGGMPPERVLLHGNAKSDHDIAASLAAGVGLLVVDSFDDIDRIERLAGAPTDVIVRINPGVLAPTHESMATGHGDSKFGIPSGQVNAALERVERSEAMNVLGLHAHIGSQIVELEPFAESVERLAGLGAFPVYDLGGGLGVRYALDEPEAPTADDYAAAILDAVDEHLEAGARILIEPGRSLVAPAAVTLYTVIGVKRGGRTFVAVDGGMGENLEPMLYGTRFSPATVDASGPAERCDLVGRHCETGDRLAADVVLAGPEVDGHVVLPVTGAYTYTMHNNYNGMPRPPVVICGDGDARLVVRRETVEDLLARNV
jgi:diaminopimelate decarboxylase